MTIRLNYILGASFVKQVPNFNIDSEGWLDWLYWMMEKNPEMNYFFTEETTDIWRDGELIITHSCSCHAQTKGPCTLCKSLGCEVWDFNQVAGLVEEVEDPYYEDWQDAMNANFDPKTPCMYIDTRPCEVIRPMAPGAEASTFFFPKQQCQKTCARFDKVIVRGGNSP